jgi:hypothetical protein
MRLAAARVVSIALLTFASVLHADDVVLRSGGTLSGTLKGTIVSLETVQGRVEAPFSANRELDVREITMTSIYK